MAANAPLTFGPTSGPCAVCGTTGSACDRCGVDFYCSEAHKEKDRARHSKGCDCLEVKESALLGRYVVAKRDIPANTLVMRELPLLRAPKQDSMMVVTPVCVGCCRVLAKRDVRSCALCGWPVCGERCARRAAHQAECAAFQRAGFKVGDAWEQGLHVWHALTGLRFALAPEEKKVALMGLQATLPEPSPEDLREESARMLLAASRTTQDALCRRAVDWLVGTAGISWVDGDEIKRGVGAMSINSFGLGAEETSYKAAVVFKGISLLEHACLPNAFMMVSDSGADGDQPSLQDDLQHLVYTTRDVRRGEHLSLAYHFAPWSSVGARRSLLLRWGFVCRCALCDDPTQRGLHMSSWYCGHCRRQGKESLVRLVDGRWHCGGCGWRADCEAGSLLGAPRLPSLSRPLDEGSGQAEASRLESRLAGGFGGQMGLDLPNLLLGSNLHDSPGLSAVTGLFKSLNMADLLQSLSPLGLGIGSESSRVPLADMEKLLREASSTLHPTNYAVLKLKSAMIRHEPSFEEGIGEARRVADYCRDLLAAADTLMPGDSRLRDEPACALAILNTEVMAYMSKQLRLGRRRVWTENQDYVKGLVPETVRLLVELKKSARSSGKKKTLGAIQKNFNRGRKHLPL